MSCLISVPPLLVFGNEHGSVEEPGCQVSQNIIYQLYATLGAFYIPLMVMILMYYKIYVAARRVVMAELKAQPSTVSSAAVCQKLLTPRSQEPDLSPGDHRIDKNDNTPSMFTRNGNENHKPTNSSKPGRMKNSSPPSASSKNAISAQQTEAENCLFEVSAPTRENAASLNEDYAKGHHSQDHQVPVCLEGPPRRRDSYSVHSRGSSSALRERKASITLGVIMTAFTVCWLPFFILALLRPFSHSVYNIPGWIVSFALWLGYANSMLNPIIYVTFHQDFRKAFRYLLCFQCATMGTRLREEAYQSQYGPTTSYSHPTAPSVHPMNHLRNDANSAQRNHSTPKSADLESDPRTEETPPTEKRVDSGPTAHNSTSNSFRNDDTKRKEIGKKKKKLKKNVSG